MRVLITILTYPGHAYCRDRFVDSVRALIEHTKTNLPQHRVDVLVLWNGDDNPGWPDGWMFKRYKPKRKERGIDILKAKNNIARKIVVKNGHDYMFNLESDTFPPPHTLTQLLNHDRDIVSAVYFIKSMEQLKVKIPTTEKYRELFKSDAGKDAYIVRQSVAPSIWGLDKGQVRPWDIHDCLPQRGLVPVYGSGIGCVLISAEVLKKISFRIVDDPKDIQQFTDFLFYHDAHQAGFRSWVDTDIICDHLHPDNDMDTSHKWFAPGTLETTNIGNGEQRYF